mmetsp:Transcript_30190/g.65988  ORF Transcript_30190/g.65988 Transcript_30190/m.65988 type:complete len:614 (-) Transcript_30190:83-1924(-)
MTQRPCTRGLRVTASQGKSDKAEGTAPLDWSRNSSCYHFDIAQVDSLLRRHSDFVIGHMERWMADQDTTLQQLLAMQMQQRGSSRPLSSSGCRRARIERQKKDSEASSREQPFEDAQSEMTDSGPMGLGTNGSDALQAIQAIASEMSEVGVRATRFRSEGSLELQREERAIRQAMAANSSSYRKSTRVRMHQMQQAAKPFRHWMRTIVRTNSFELFFAMAILLNSAMIGIEVDYSSKNPNTTATMFFYICQVLFTLVFTVEFLCRVIADGMTYYFCSKDWMWNWFDACILSACIFETVVLTIETKSEEMSNMDNLSVIRMLRITRILRTFRATRAIRVVSALRTLVFSIIHTLKSLVWAMALLVMDMYLYGIVFTEAAADYIGRGGGKYEEAMDEFWGDLLTSIFTLFKSICGGLSWHEAVRPLGDAHALLVILFATYVAFTYFAVLNVVTGFFCHSAIETAERDPDMIAHRLMERRQDYAEKLRKLFRSVDEDGSGAITVEELEKLLTDRSLQANFEALGLDTQDAWTLFKLFDKDRTNSIEVEEFVEGCIRLRGSAKGIDIAKLTDDQLADLSMSTRILETQMTSNNWPPPAGPAGEAMDQRKASTRSRLV